MIADSKTIWTIAPDEKTAIKMALHRRDICFSNFDAALEARNNLKRQGKDWEIHEVRFIIEVYQSTGKYKPWVK